MSNVILILGPRCEDELQAADLIYLDGMLRSIGPFDILKRFIKKLDNGKTTVGNFGFDWRVSIDLSTDRLIDALELLLADTWRKTIVVAHSMGGLVVHGTMQRRPDLFRGLVYAGFPSEYLNIIGLLRDGDSVMFSDRIFTFETNFMMRLTYWFLSLSGRVFINKHTGKNYDLDFFDPETWVAYNLNPLVAEFRRDLELLCLAQDLLRHIYDASAPSTQPASCLLSMNSISSCLKLLPTNLTRKSAPLLVTNNTMAKIHKRGKTPAKPLAMSEYWANYRFAPLFTAAYNYLADTLKRAEEYMLLLEYRADIADKYPPLAVVTATRCRRCAGRT